MKKIMAVFVTIAVILVLSGGIAYTVYYTFFKPNDTVVPAFSEGGLNLVIEGEVINAGKPLIEDNEILLPLDVIKSHLDPHIYWDEGLQKVTVTTKDRVIRMKTDSLNALVNNNPISLAMPVINRNGSVYIPVKFLSDFYDIDIQYIKDTNAVLIDFRRSVIQPAEVTAKGAVIRSGMSIRYPLIRKFDIETEKPQDLMLRVFEKYDKWYKVRTADGEIGYIEDRFVSLKPAVHGKTPEQEAKDSFAWNPGTGRINLVWDQLWSSKKLDLSGMPDMDGLDIISPTWFQLASENGKLISRAYPQYVEWAHSKGYKVWAMLNNDFGNEKMSSAFLANSDYRDSLIKELLAYSALYKLDGINIDFENVNSGDRENLTQFVRELTPFLHEQGLVVTMDVNDQACYDRKALADAVDYIALMAYDQHHRSSSTAGSVSQIPWAESLVERYLADIPAQKLLLGMPFYTRIWKEETTAEGKINLTSEAVSMGTARKAVSENKAEVRWDEDSGQFYSEYIKDNATYKVWLEDSNSISLRLSLVHKYGLAGAACWSRNFAEPDIWAVLKKDLKNITSYSQWQSNNSNKKYFYW